MRDSKYFIHSSEYRLLQWGFCIGVIYAALVLAASTFFHQGVPDLVAAVYLVLGGIFVGVLFTEAYLDVRRSRKFSEAAAKFSLTWHWAVVALAGLALLYYW